MSKVIAHIDLNAFFARAEEIKNPSLQNKPIAVGGVGRSGIVSTCSYTARKYGVHSGMPTFKAQQLCKDLIVINGDYRFYSLLSNEFIQFVKSFTPIIEQMSIDECFCDFTSVFLDKKIKPEAYFRNIQLGLFKKTGLKCSIGIGPTKFIAKMASDIKKPLGLTIIHKKDIAKYLFPLPVGSYFGIGVKSVPKLNAIGINTIGDLYYGLKSKEEKITNFYGKYGQDIINHLEGNSSDVVNTVFDDKQLSISNRDTLPYDMNDASQINPYLLNSFEVVYSRFKKLKMLCGGITISYRYNNFKTKTFAKKLSEITDNKEKLMSAVIAQFNKTYNNEYIRQIGVIFDRLTPKLESQIQMNMFDFEDYEEENKLDDIITQINKNLDSDSALLFRASKLLENKKNENK